MLPAAPSVTDEVIIAPSLLRMAMAAQSSVSTEFTRVSENAATSMIWPTRWVARLWIWQAWLTSTPPSSPAQVPRHGCSA
ncbi:hypothetical protein D3C87_1760130 [compost metagenome]